MRQPAPLNNAEMSSNKAQAAQHLRAATFIYSNSLLVRDIYSEKVPIVFVQLKLTGKRN